MYDILKLNKISSKIESILTDGYNLTDSCENPDGIILRSFNMAEYAVGDKLVAIGRAGAGVNNIPVDKMSEKGVVVFNTPGANANAVKELVLCGMLLASRDIIGGNKWVNQLPADETVAKATEKGKSAFGGTEIKGKTLGVLGAGAIGLLVANAAVALGMKVIAYDPYLSEANKSKLDMSVKIADVDEVYAEADMLTIHIPYLPSTKNMINADVLAKCKSGLILLNMSRAELVDVDAIKAAISSGKVRKYVVDFPTAAVLNSENVIVLPHLGASTEEAEENCAEMAATQLKDYLENGNVTNSVNFPALKKEKSKAYRTCVLCKASALEEVLKVFASSDIAKAIRGDYAYVIADSDVAFDGKLSVDGVLKIR